MSSARPLEDGGEQHESESNISPCNVEVVDVLIPEIGNG